MRTTPTDILADLVRRYPNARQHVDAMLAGRGRDLPDWPAWCLVPMAGWYSIVSAAHAVDRLDLHQIGDVARLAAVGTWRYTQGIYRYDPDVLEMVAGTEVSGDLPCDVLLRLPEWAVYVDTRGLSNMPGLDGFWAHLECDANSGQHELRLLLHQVDALLPIPIHLGVWSLHEAIDRVRGVADRNFGGKLSLPDVAAVLPHVQPLVSLLLYLCSDDPEIGLRESPQVRPSMPLRKILPSGAVELRPASRTRIWMVGQEIGKKTREAFAREPEPSTGRTVAPHVRRGHWHGHWSGPRTGEQRYAVKWHAPTFVASRLDGK